MNEYISRQAAIEVLGEEPDVLFDGEDEWAIRSQWRYDVDAIKAVPAADVVKVVRCKDCKHLANRDETGGKCWRGSGFARVVENDDFCSYGEKRKE